jgi:hypothetical protein
MFIDIVGSDIDNNFGTFTAHRDKLLLREIDNCTKNRFVVCIMNGDMSEAIMVSEDEFNRIYLCLHEKWFASKRDEELNSTLGALKNVVNSEAIREAPFYGYCEAIARAKDLLKKHNL